MCTLVILHRVRPDLPLVVAANRDELYAREASGPALLLTEPRAIGGRDGLSGGTWMGATAGGLFVGLTNQRSWRPGPGPRSRGSVVLEALRSGSVAGVERLLAALDPSEVASFNLLFGDGERARIAYSRREMPQVELVELSPGLHVLPNDRLLSAEFPKILRAAALAEPLVQLPWPALASGLASLLGDHRKPSLAEVPQPPPDSPFSHELVRELQAICIHTPLYGTRSATIAALSPGTVAHYLFADGPPCRTPFADVTALLGPGR